MSKGILALFGGTLLILLMVATVAGVTSFRASTQTANFAVTTGAGETSANVTLPLAVLDDSLVNITSVTSNNTADAPTATALVAASKLVNVGALNAADSRRLTVIYWSPKLDAYLGVDLVAKWWLLFIAVGIIAVIIGAIVNGLRHD